MAAAFRQAIEAGVAARGAGPMRQREFAEPSTPVVGQARWREDGTLDPFYPIVDSADWVRRLVGVGARLIQLRMKDKDDATVAAEARAALKICRDAGATLVVNDFWRVAIDVGAQWVHLGQGDLDAGADVGVIRRAGLKLGLSTHDEAELARALALKPDYVALGPIYPTVLKAMASRRRDSSASANGRSASERCAGRHRRAQRRRAKACLAAGADVVSVVTDVTLNPDPEARAREWIAATRGMTARAPIALTIAGSDSGGGRGSRPI